MLTLTDEIVIKKFIEQSNLIEGEPEEADKYSYDALEDLLGSNQLSPYCIRVAHHGLMRDKLRKGAGVYRDGLVTIGGRIPPASEFLPSLMDEWCEKYKDAKNIYEIFEAHIAFEKIHCFWDGNGRIGRLIILAQCIKNDVDIPLFLNKRKQTYYQIFSEHLPIKLIATQKCIKYCSSDHMAFIQQTFDT